MKLFVTSHGFIFAFGFNKALRKHRPRQVCWCDPTTKDWTIEISNLAGSVSFPFNVAPEFVREIHGGIIAYQPGVCIEFRLVGPPLVWCVSILMAEQVWPVFPLVSDYGRAAEGEANRDEESLARTA